MDGVTTLRVGALELAVVSDGLLKLPVNAMFGEGQSSEWRTRVELDDGRVPFAVNCLLVRSGERHILIDTGCGSLRGDPAMLERYGTKYARVRATSSRCSG
jgi:hypothetical protein